MSDHALAGKHVLVTGAASGIGRTVADLLLQEGARVTGLDRNTVDAPFPMVQVDLADPANIDAALAQVEGPVDGLVNSAGVSGQAPAQLVARVNVLGLAAVSRWFADQASAGASVVNVASQAGYQVPQDTSIAADILPHLADWARADELLARDERFQAAAYDYSKHLIHRLTQLNAARWIARGVRSTSVSPGPVATPLADDFRASMGDERYDGATRAVGRVATTTDIAEVVLFLLSPRSAWVNGTDIATDGGLMAVRRSAALN